MPEGENVDVFIQCGFVLRSSCQVTPKRKKSMFTFSVAFCCEVVVKFRCEVGVQGKALPLHAGKFQQVWQDVHVRNTKYTKFCKLCKHFQNSGQSTTLTLSLAISSFKIQIQKMLRS